MTRIGVGKGKIPEIFNDFSTYVEFGGEDCVLEDARVNISDEERITIVVSVAAAPLDVAVGLVKPPPVDENQKGSGEEVKWQPLPQVHAYSVTQPKKDWQLRVLKKWPSYHIAHSFSIVPVSRRYEHFDWLRERLEAKYPFVSIPPLPDKPNPGEDESLPLLRVVFDEIVPFHHGEPESTETLRRRLESWLQRVGEHPVLARSLIWKHFITCNDERDWARGKRMAEWDRFIGAKFFLAIDAPETRLCLESVGRHGVSAGLDDVKNALTFMGKSYCRLATLCENQPKTDWELMREKILEYLSMLSPFRHIFRLHKVFLIRSDRIGLRQYRCMAHRNVAHTTGAVAKRKEYERLRAEGKCEPENVDGVLRREEIVSYAVLAEMAHFRQLLHTDLYIFVKTLLSEQIAFYTQAWVLWESVESIECHK
ncbi:unnamed protein product [Darwinula stevensoni]|uniref:PX domain-containing protein n=1 Tax=Darwinula stevensoni TaxID=69355 RepID=A0A7R9AC41_9CRUS|nr:unnamed protein product [Darwinula stevensoni]CAG0899467.1 unnamed protein product [Darwinula stevensoni]